jgi:hypothetical protein
MPMTFFTKLETKIHMKVQKAPTAQATLRKRSKARGIRFQDFRATKQHGIGIKTDMYTNETD